VELNIIHALIQEIKISSSSLEKGHELTMTLAGNSHKLLSVSSLNTDRFFKNFYRHILWRIWKKHAASRDMFAIARPLYTESVDFMLNALGL